MNVEEILNDAVLSEADVELGEVISFVLWIFLNFRRQHRYSKELDEALISLCMYLVCGLIERFEIVAKT
jgi:hypothetical protein